MCVWAVRVLEMDAWVYLAIALLYSPHINSTIIYPQTEPEVLGSYEQGLEMSTLSHRTVDGQNDPKDPKLWELWYIPYNG